MMLRCAAIAVLVVGLFGTRALSEASAPVGHPPVIVRAVVIKLERQTRHLLTGEPLDSDKISDAIVRVDQVFVGPADLVGQELRLGAADRDQAFASLGAVGFGTGAQPTGRAAGA